MSPNISREVGGAEANSACILHVAINDAEKYRRDVLEADSCFQEQKTEVQDLHGKLLGSYIKPEMKVEIYSLYMGMRVWHTEEELWQSRSLLRQEKPVQNHQAALQQYRSQAASTEK